MFNILEEVYFEILLVNARHMCNVQGHKTDKNASQWLSKMFLSGLLKGSFIHPVEIRELRDLVRYKRKVVSQCVSEKNRLIKILKDANIKRPKELSPYLVKSAGYGANFLLNVGPMPNGKIQPEHVERLKQMG
ncbi:MAG: transposase, partial [Bacteroidota bacterium]